MINKVNYELLLWYYVYYAGDGLVFSSVYWTSLVRLSVQRRQTLQQGTGCTPRDLWPCQLPRRGAELICQLWLQLSPTPLFWTLSPGAGEPVCRRVSLCWPVTPSTELRFCGRRDGGREPGTSARTCMDRLALQGVGAAAVPRPTCLYYIVLTKSPCLTKPLFLYSNGETLLVYVFDNCTNAPLWKRKMKPWHIWTKWAICVFIWIWTPANTPYTPHTEPQFWMVIFIFKTSPQMNSLSICLAECWSWADNSPL